MTFHVGQKVVCVDATEHPSHPNYLQVGKVYEIASFGLYPRHEESCVYLVGIKRVFAGYDFPFGQHRFRPAVERKTDISVFTRMLTDTRVSA